MRRAALAVLVLIFSPTAALPWGLVAHRIVTEAAVQRMPPDVAPFFAGMSARLQDASVEPDTVLRARDKKGEEPPRHFIDLDAYEPWPFAGVPRAYDDARELLGEAKVKKYGVLPWRIAGVMKDLTAAMRRKDGNEIALQAGYLSHYLGDSFQPLHLTLNYDGQATCNAGIHHAFEAEMIERQAQRFRESLKLERATASAVAHPVLFLFDRMRETYPLVQRLLEADTLALREMKSQGKDYWVELDRRAGPIAERQLSAAATAVASFWYTAWLDAGKPALPDR